MPTDALSWPRLAGEARGVCGSSVQVRGRQEEARPGVDWMRAEGKPSPGPLVMWLWLCSGYR